MKDKDEMMNTEIQPEQKIKQQTRETKELRGKLSAQAETTSPRETSPGEHAAARESTETEKTRQDQRLAGTGMLYVVGIGPGTREEMTLRAVKAIEASEMVVGYKLYLELLGDLLQDKETVSSGMRREVERCHRAVQEAAGGKVTSLVSSGDAGIYGMAGIALQVAQETCPGLQVEIIPGVTAASAAAAGLGAPLMHDFAVISLSDLLTPWEKVEERLHRAGQGDFVVVLYNPKSRGRTRQVIQAQEILSQYRAGSTPVGIVRNAGRPGEATCLTTLETMLEEEIDMTSTVLVGNSQSYVSRGRMITPRGYAL